MRRAFGMHWVSVFFVTILFAGAVMAQDTTKGKMSNVFVVIDSSGNKTDVVDLKIRVQESNQIVVTTQFTIYQGAAQLTFNFNQLIGFKNHWKTNEVTLFFPDGKPLRGKLPEEVKFHSVIGEALINGEQIEFALKVEKLDCAFRKGYEKLAKEIE